MTGPVELAPTAPRAALRAEGICVRYGGVQAVVDVTLRVEPGTVVGLIGPNGAGKTSFIDALTGFTPCAGRVWLGDREITDLPAHRRAAVGLVRTWQSMELFDELSVRQNVLVGAEPSSARRVALDLLRPGRASDADRVERSLAFLGLTADADRHPSELPLGRQKLLGVARALGMDPSVLLLDEPAAGLDPSESAAFGRHLRTIADAGLGVLLVDHDMELVLDVCDRIYVIHFGGLLAEGTPQEVRGDDRVIDAYLGRSDHAAVVES